jgi:hydrogenase nickel incorporation protein HypA/HybF
MHELAICQALLEQVGTIAREHGASVSRVRLSVGPLSGVEPALLERAYPLACAGTMAEGSELAIELAPVRVRCRSCGVESAASANRLLCANCGDWQTDLTSGDELVLLSVEMREAACATSAAATSRPATSTWHGSP